METSATNHHPSPTMRRALLALAGMAAGLLVLFGPAALPAQAQNSTTGTTLTVDTDADEDNSDGDCSLREAIQAANDNAARDACPAGSASGEDLIGFDLGSSAATITLGSTLPTVTDAAGLAIDAATADAPVSVSGNDKVRVLDVDSGAKLVLSGLTVTRGLVYDPNPEYHTQYSLEGGGIRNQGDLELNNVTISSNLTVTHGGGISNGIGGSLKVTDSTFSDNGASYRNGTSGQRGVGGAISNYYSGAVEVSNTTFTRNGAYQGGAIFGAPMKVSNSTFAHNGCGVGGCAIFTGYSSAPTEVSNSTFFENQQPGFGQTWGHSINGTATVRNTVFAESREACYYGSTLITDGGYNIDRGGTCGFGEANNSLSNTDPLLDPAGVKDNGGPIKTIALQPASPAIDLIPQGANGCATDLIEDQRGETRPKGQGCDAGAFEAEDDRAPGAPTIASPAEGSFNPGSFSVSGTAEKGATVELFEGDQTVVDTDTADASGGWTVDLTGVTEGPHSYTAKATDEAGNTSQESEARTVVVDTSAPTLDTDNSDGSDGITPDNNATGVSPKAQPTATFSDEMDPTSLTGSTVKLHQWNAKKKKWQPVAVGVSVEGKTATLDPYPADPKKRLGAKTRYKVTVTTGAKNLVGLPLGSAKSWTFTTR